MQRAAAGGHAVEPVLEVPADRLLLVVGVAVRARRHRADPAVSEREHRQQASAPADGEAVAREAAGPEAGVAEDGVLGVGGAVEGDARAGVATYCARATWSSAASFSRPRSRFRTLRSVTVTPSASCTTDAASTPNSAERPYVLASTWSRKCSVSLWGTMRMCTLKSVVRRESDMASQRSDVLYITEKALFSAIYQVYIPYDGRV